MDLHHVRNSPLEAFRTAVLGNQRYQAELRQARSAADVLALASNLGFAITAEELLALDGARPITLTEPELEGIAGAAPCWCDASVTKSVSCRPQ